MTIEVLYVPGCPNFQPAVKRMEKVLAAQSLQANIKTVAVSSDAEARVLHFFGSPTIRVNGQDVEPTDMKASGLSCRLYANGSGIPSEEMIQTALSNAIRGGSMRVAERATPIAAVIAAVSTLACCLPLGFLGAVGLASLSLWARSYGVWLLGLSAVLLLVGFVQLYRGRNQCRKRSTVSVVLFWVAVAAVVLITLFPQLIASLVAGS